ncbi:patellin-3-like [Lotus japonicus]|uniref:patellin-3-like n=1 Tax=Lotus japonicus TaxID=34305 RepID=UPI002582B496|nr:patellin-3-like [Lotus japonicus]
MAEQVPNTLPLAEDQVVVTDVAAAEPADKETQQPKPEEEKPVEAETEVSKPGGGDEVPESGSFKEESNIVADLPDAESKALQEFKLLVQTALNNHEFSAPDNPPPQGRKNSDGAENQPDKPSKPPVADVAGEPAPPPEEESDDVKGSDDEPSKPPLADVGKATVPPLEEESEPAAAAEKEEAEAVAGGESEVKETTTKVVAGSAVDDDGAKTVEAIEETVVAVAAAAPEEEAKVVEEEAKASPEEVSIWGIPLLADERSDVILLKFLRARDFKVKEAFAMIKSTILWRKEFGIDGLLEEDLGDDLEKAVYMHGSDKEGHPVCYNIYGEFQDKELYKKTFSDEEKRQKFLRWRIQFLEKSIRKLDFTPAGISTIVQVNDLKNSPGPAKWELRQATKQALQLLQDNYPEFVAKQVFINVPWWYLAVNRMISPFLTQRTKSKFVFAGPSKSAETLLRYIAPEQLPVKYGGLSKDGEFGVNDAVTEITVRPAAKHTVEFPVTENGLLSWELRVIGWDVSYGAEFVPSAEGSYTVIIQKARKVASSEEPVLCQNYKIGEPGKVVLTIDNQSSKKKKLLYRLKTKPTSD